MGRRRRRVTNIPKKKLPKVFICPKCGKKSLSIKIKEIDLKAIIKCRECGMIEDTIIKSAFKEIDVYCNYIDNIYN